MPRKKTAKDKKSQIQKQKIAARLLEISFKADDYIYKKKSISVEHAKKYLEEVEKFEPKCQGDVRSMQVIEKLIHMMKSIIEQGKTSQGSTSQSSYNPLNITSTNASTLDGTLNSTRSIQVQTSKSFEIQNIINHLEKTGEDFDKTNATDSKRIQLDKAVVEFNRDRTLSNLSLSIIDPVNKEILENIIQISEDYFTCTQNVENFIIAKENNLTGAPIQASKDQIQTRKCTDSGQTQNYTVAKTPPIIIIDLDDDAECRKTVVNNIPSNTATLKLYDEIIVKNSIDKPMKLGVNKIDPEKSKDTKQRKKDNQKKANTKPKRARRNSKVNPDTIVIDDITANKNRQRKTTKEVVCDLTWVENIKYVRVIEPSEYDASFAANNLQDTFWDNFYLPYDFSQYF